MIDYRRLKPVFVTEGQQEFVVRRPIWTPFFDMINEVRPHRLQHLLILTEERSSRDRAIVFDQC